MSEDFRRVTALDHIARMMIGRFTASANSIDETMGAIWRYVDDNSDDMAA